MSRRSPRPAARGASIPPTKRLDRSGEAALNAFDVNAVEEALRVKEATGDAEVVVLSLGPARALDSLRKALAMGADRAVLVSDEGAAGSDLVATSRVLAKALEREGADLVLFGQQSSDSDGAVLWAAVADRLRMPLVSQAAELDRRRRQGDREAADRVRLRPDRGAAPGRDRRLRRDQRAALPVAEGDHGREVQAAGDRRRSADLGVDASDAGEAGSKTEVLALGAPPPRGDSRKIEDDGSGAQQILDFLVEKKLV